MTNRRQFLQTAATLSVASSAASAAPLGRSAFAGADGALNIDALICDKRYAQGQHFAAAAASLNVPLRTIEGDITGLWHNELQALWKTGPAVIGGLSERHALFLLERLAWDHGLRVVFEAEHEALQQGGFRHNVLRSSDDALAARLTMAGEHWPALLAAAMVQAHRSDSKNFHPTDAAMSAYLGETTKLYSWIIASRQAVQS